MTSTSEQTDEPPSPCTDNDYEQPKQQRAKTVQGLQAGLNHPLRGFGESQTDFDCPDLKDSAFGTSNSLRNRWWAYMRSYKLLAATAVGLLALSGCSSIGSQAPAVQEGTVVSGCKIAPNSNCQGVKLTGQDLHSANLSGANLTGADISGANLNGANLTNANLTGAKVWYTDLEGADLTGATTKNAEFANANLINATCPDGSKARNSVCPNV